MRRYIVQTASAAMPSTCKGRYGRVAVLLVDLDVLAAAGRERPAAISERSRGVVRVVQTWERRNRGGYRSAFEVARREATMLALELNLGAGYDVFSDARATPEGLVLGDVLAQSSLAAEVLP